MEMERSFSVLTCTEPGIWAWKRGSRAFDGVHHLDGVGIGLAEHRQRDRAFALEHREGLGRLDAVLDVCHVAQIDRRAIARGHHDGTELAGAL